MDLTQITPTSVFDIFSQIKLVKLETSPESMIGFIAKTKYHKGFYYILDSKMNEIKCFDDAGRFSFKISSIGRGGGEYLNLSDFAIDKYNDNLIILDAPMHRILRFDLRGEYIGSSGIYDEKTYGFNSIFSLTDSLLLLTSINNEQLVFFDFFHNVIVRKDFLQLEPLKAFSPNYNVYQFNSYTYALPAMSQQVYNVSNVDPVPHYLWSFGANDNTKRQIKNLKEELKRRGNNPNAILFPHKAVGVGNILCQHIFKVFETSRYRIALVEFDNNWRHVIVDKNSGESFIFNHFEEQVSLFTVCFYENLAIAVDKSARDKLTQGIDRYPELEELLERVVDGFNISVFSSLDQQIIANHNPMTDNPFLVVYTFKE